MPLQNCSQAEVIRNKEDVTTKLQLTSVLSNPEQGVRFRL